MIINQNVVQVQKSSNFESTEFRIDGKYKNKVLWMLINQYRFKIRTPVQEIISNARDAQRENGNPDKPIKIQLPTSIDPTFIVRDFGVGMNEERIKTIFTSFGASTKNDDNTQTGGFGIGAKSPLAYTDSFNIKTYVDGQYWFYVIAKTENDGIGINLLDTGMTTEENGTEVQIPVGTYDKTNFIDSACRCTMFWDVQPEFNLDDDMIKVVKNGTKIADNFIIYQSNDLSNLFQNDFIIVIDGIPYELDSYLLNKVEKLKNINDRLNYRAKGVLFLNTGDIDLLQTRESIDETEKTLSELQKVGFKAFSDMEIYIESSLTENSLEGRLKQYQALVESIRDIGYRSFETFQLNFIKSGNAIFYIDKKLPSLFYNFEGKTGKVITPQKCVNHISFKHTDLNNFYWDDLKDSESDIMKARRLRNELIENDNSAIVIRQGVASNFVYLRTLRLLNAKKLSSLELPVKTTRAKGAKQSIKKLPENITIHKLNTSNSYYNSKVTREVARTRKISDISTKYVYTGYTDYSEQLESIRFINFLKGQKIQPCRLSKPDIKLIKNNENFVHINDYLKTFKASKELINFIIIQVVGTKNKEIAKLVVKSTNKIQDKVLTKLAHHVKMLESDIDRLPLIISDKIRKDNNIFIKNRVTIVERFSRLLETKYPLLHSSVSRQVSINYINNKAR